MGISYIVYLFKQTPTMKAVLAAALLSVAAGAPAAQLIAAHPAGYAAQDLAEPPVYNYQYGVSDDYSGASFQQSETRDGYATSGSYTVALPDGRIQTVKYTDNGDGIIQDVTYEGDPQYGPAVVAHAVAHPIAHAVAHPVVHAVAHPVGIAHPVAIAHPIAHAVAHPVAVAHPALGHPIAHALAPVFH